jgi:hypothetical protein
MRSCRDHDHPKLKRPVSRKKIRAELAALCRRAGFQGPLSLEWPESLARTHNRNHRRYAQVAPYTRPPEFELARQTRWLPARHRRGLLAHEVGHVLDPEGTEDQADEAALEALGIRIGYDKRWPGKGLQVARNPEFRRRVARARSLPSDWGEGWLTRSARDQVRIALFAGFLIEDLMPRLLEASRRSRGLVNAGTVRRIMQELS